MSDAMAQVPWELLERFRQAGSDDLGPLVGELLTNVEPVPAVPSEPVYRIQWWSAARQRWVLVTSGGEPVELRGAEAAFGFVHAMAEPENRVNYRVVPAGRRWAPPPAGQVTDPITSQVRQFATGAKRDSDEAKINPEGALHPAVLRVFCEYMKAHTTMRDGTQREADNWQEGMSPESYMESLLRHVFDAWEIHRGGSVTDHGQKVTLTDALCGVVFNAFGRIHHELGLCKCPPTPSA